MIGRGKKSLHGKFLDGAPQVNRADRYFFYFLRTLGWGVSFLLLAILIVLFLSAGESFNVFGFSFVWSQEWDPVMELYGALPFIFGTVVTSLLALAISTPPCVALALFNSELCPLRLRSLFSFMVEMLAAIPSIVYGMWALFVLAPFVRDTIYPFTQWLAPGFIFFRGPSFGIGIFTATLVLSIMISPVITAMTTEIFKTVPQTEKMAALALGCTRWEMIKVAVLSRSRSGILGAMTMGLGRALGETMAVAMVIGNNPEIKASLFAAGSTMASVIANEYAEALNDLHLSTLNYIAFILFIVSFLINVLTRIIMRKAGLHASL